MKDIKKARREWKRSDKQRNARWEQNWQAYQKEERDEKHVELGVMAEALLAAGVSISRR